MLKYIEDYYEKVHEKFPDLEIWEIEKILKHGMQSFFMLNNNGADVLIRSPRNKFCIYVGKSFVNKTIFYRYQALKLRIKYRLKYKLKTKSWNGYYYLGLTEEQYNKYIPKKKGRYKYKINLDSLTALKVKEETYIFPNNKYFFAIKMDEEKGWSISLDGMSSRNLTLYAKRDINGKIVEI